MEHRIPKPALVDWEVKHKQTILALDKPIDDRGLFFNMSEERLSVHSGLVVKP